MTRVETRREMQPRIRTVKPEFYTHTILFDLEQRSHMPIRLAFSGLWTVCDRDGRFRWEPRELKLHVLPYDDVDFTALLDTLRTEGFILQYEVEGKVYGCIPTWTKHQRPNKREQNSRLPAPPPAVPEPPAQLELTERPITHVHARASTWGTGTGTGTGRGTGTGTPYPLSAVAPDVKTTETQNTAPKTVEATPAIQVIPYIDDDVIPPGLSEVEYARRFLGDVGLPEKGNIYVAADAIKALSKSRGLSLVSSFEQIRARALDDRDRGVAVDHLWILNGRYNQPTPRSKSDVATADYADRLQRELAILRRSGASA